MSKFREIFGDNREIFTKFSMMILGNFLCSFAINVFFVPNGLMSTGVAGLSIIANYLFNIPIGLMFFLINLPIILVGLKMLDKKTMAYTVISTVIYSYILDNIIFLREIIIIDDIILATVFGGFINGLGMGILFRNGLTQGGFDIPALIMRRKFNTNIGTGLSILNNTVLFLTIFEFGLIYPLYTIIAIQIAYSVLDRVHMGLDKRKTIMLISNKPRELADEIMVRLNRGVTLIEGKGAYTGDRKEIIYCTIDYRELPNLKKIVEEIDPTAFYTITNATEVAGRGFAKLN